MLIFNARKYHAGEVSVPHHFYIEKKNKINKLFLHLTSKSFHLFNLII